MKKKKQEENTSSITCCECHKSFDEDDTILVCSCDEVVCEDCRDKHNCISYDDYSNESCCECGGLDESMYQCDKCQDYFCENCKEEHAKSEMDFEEESYGDYIKERVVDGL